MAPVPPPNNSTASANRQSSTTASAVASTCSIRKNSVSSAPSSAASGACMASAPATGLQNSTGPGTFPPLNADVAVCASVVNCNYCVPTASSPKSLTATATKSLLKATPCCGALSSYVSIASQIP